MKNTEKQIIQIQTAVTMLFASIGTFNSVNVPNALMGTFHDTMSIEEIEKMAHYGDGSLMKVLEYMNEPQRAKLILYIMKKYEGVTWERVKRSYLEIYDKEKTVE